MYIHTYTSLDYVLFTLAMHLPCTCIHFAAITQYGWKRENGKLDIHVVWEISENIAKSKASIEFFLAGCKCKTGCTTRISSCRKKERSCGPSCLCHFCKNNPNATKESCMNDTDLVVQDLLEEPSDDTYIEESDDDLEEFRSEEMDDDEELRVLMDFVFGPNSDEEI